MIMKNVVITGIGAVTPLGNDMRATWDGLTKGRSGVGAITRFDPEGLPSRIAGELRGFDPLRYLTRKEVIRLDPFVLYAASAAIMAADDAGLIHQGAVHDPWRAGVVIGSGRGGITSMEKALEGHLLRRKPFSAYLMSASTINMAASFISMKMGIRGPVLGIATACASGTHAVGEAFRMIRNGAIDAAVAGGTEAPLCRLAVAGYGSSGALSGRNEDPERASRPFDRGRDGFVIAEGACVLVLEEQDRALSRGARIYAELSGYGATSDAAHQTRPDSRGEAAAIRKALDDAGIGTDEIDYINAHGTSTPLGDTAEAQALQQVFGRRAGEIPVSSCKSMMGHMLGAAGAAEAAATALSLCHGIIPPTINLEDPDPGCPLNVGKAAVKKQIRCALTNSFGFGGVNAVLALRKFMA
ncbi:MAG: beta-ketoacyl-ACP synthase II [Nitrospiraceae bacterium]|nr:MAG: beta-ketoacyl-ACP synthase II [Nitrospiraceae bacterium]